MAAGNDTFMGLAVPLYGNFEIIATDSTKDIMTLTAAGGTATDFLVCQTSAGTEEFVIKSDGTVEITAGGFTMTSGDLTLSASKLTVPTNYFMRFTTIMGTTAPTTGINYGDIFVYEAANIPTLAWCVETTPTGNTMWRKAFTNN